MIQTSTAHENFLNFKDFVRVRSIRREQSLVPKHCPMRASCCTRARTAILYSDAKLFHPRNRRSISAVALHAEHEVSNSTAPPPSPNNLPPSPPEPESSAPKPNRHAQLPEHAQEDVRFGSDDYIPRKRGYAPNIQMPRNFNLPKPPPKIPDHEWPIAEAKPRAIRSIRSEYKHKLSAMRRGYLEWYRETRKMRFLRQKAYEERPRRAPPPFKIPPAEALASSSEPDIKEMERILFGSLSRKSEKQPGEGYKADRHQRLLLRQRRQLINDYLALYHTSQSFITTPEQLDAAIIKAFPDITSSYERDIPQDYAEILKDVEEGSSAQRSGAGYITRMNKDKEKDLFNAMVGTVGERKSGHDDVLATLGGEAELERLKTGIKQRNERRLDVEKKSKVELFNVEGNEFDKLGVQIEPGSSTETSLQSIEDEDKTKSEKQLPISLSEARSVFTKLFELRDEVQTNEPVGNGRDNDSIVGTILGRIANIEKERPSTNGEQYVKPILAESDKTLGLASPDSDRVHTIDTADSRVNIFESEKALPTTQTEIKFEQRYLLITQHSNHFSPEKSVIELSGIIAEEPWSSEETKEQVSSVHEAKPILDDKSFSLHRFPTQADRKEPRTEIPQGPVPFNAYSPAQLEQLRREYRAQWICLTIVIVQDSSTHQHIRLNLLFPTSKKRI
jgi:hypothetical protein